MFQYVYDIKKKNSFFLSFTLQNYELFFIYTNFSLLKYIKRGDIDLIKSAPLTKIYYNALIINGVFSGTYLPLI